MPSHNSALPSTPPSNPPRQRSSSERPSSSSRRQRSSIRRKRSSSKHSPAPLALLVLLLSLFGSLLVSTAGPAAATTPGSAYIQEASRHNGQPYVYGAMGPTRFDCSGFTKYVFSRFGKTLPHNSAAQYNYVRHIAKTSKQVGDILFFRTSSGITHVGIYAGGSSMWDAPKAGDHVRKRPIYSSNYLVGRV